MAQDKEACYMNDRPNGRRRERGAHSREELAQNRPADYTDRPRRSGGKRKNGKALYYGVLVLLLACWYSHR